MLEHEPSQCPAQDAQDVLLKLCRTSELSQTQKWPFSSLTPGLSVQVLGIGILWVTIQNVARHLQEKKYCRSVRKLTESSKSTGTRAVVLAVNGRFILWHSGTKEAGIFSLSSKVTFPRPTVLGFHQEQQKAGNDFSWQPCNFQESGSGNKGGKAFYHQLV